ncbi:MAG: FtsQ-type POTRA domain-containing protein [Clostridia bacterium]|nr:FtsQ-type POTRA domain-containing protein [Clostridia bacterium]
MTQNRRSRPAARRSARRKSRGALPWAVAGIALAAALWLLLTSAVFVVRDIQVVGAGAIDEDDVRRLSGIRLGTRLSALDAEKVRLEVESDGRVAFVSLETRFPNRAVLTVRPRTMDALVLLAGAGRVLVLDSDAYVVQVTSRLPDAAIPYVTGLKAPYYQLGRQLDTADGRCACMKAVVEALKANGATAYASELSVADTANLYIITRKGTTVLLGDESDMNRKIAWMAGALADLEARGENGGRLDVSSGTKADYMPPEGLDGTGANASGADETQVDQTQVGTEQTEVGSSDAAGQAQPPES